MRKTYISRPDPKFLQTKCICCDCDEIVHIGSIQPAINFAGQLLSEPLAGGELVRCRNCNVSFRFPQLDKNSLDELYRQGRLDNWQSMPTDRADWQIAGSWLLDYLKPNSEILDIGCFDGGFLATVERSHNRFGVEIHEEAGKRAQEHGIKIIGKDFAGLAKVGAAFDAVTSFDVIEHAQNPLEYLSKIVEATRENGIIVISTGNSDALTWRLMGAKYWYCTIGEHLSFINPKWCEWAGDRLGIELKHMVKFSHGRFSWKQRVGNFVKNLFYLIFPGGFSILRQMGMGGDEFRVHKEMLKHPPGWMSAKDHFICLFVKRCKKI